MRIPLYEYVSTFPVGISNICFSLKCIRISRIIRNLCSKHQHLRLHQRSFRTKNVETSLRPSVYLYLAVFAECFLADGFAGGWERRLFEFKARPHHSNATQPHVVECRSDVDVALDIGAKSPDCISLPALRFRFTL